MARKMLDCREVGNEIGCTLALTGGEDEVVDAAARHAVAVHGHDDGDELRAMIRGSLRDAPQATGPGAFVQLIEFRTEHPEQIDEMIDSWVDAIGADRTAQWMVLGADRDRPGTYLEVVAFPSHDAAMRNSDHPATGQFAAKLADVCDGTATFRNVDVTRAETP